MCRNLLLSLTALLIPSSVRAEPLALAPVFTDSMVLQRAVVVPVWGHADAGAAITVTFADQQKITKADEKGNWRVALDALTADAELRSLKVVAGEEALLIRDVLVGEVWVAAGQSNEMVRPSS